MNTRYVLSLLLSGAAFLGLSAQDGKAPKADVKTSQKEAKVSESGTAVHQERFYFPMIVSKDLSYSSNLFAEAAMRFYDTHAIRQDYLSWFTETYPVIAKNLKMEQATLPGTDAVITVYRVNSKFIRAILEDTSLSVKGTFPAIIDSLIMHDVFLGGDIPTDIVSRKLTQVEKDAILLERLTATSKPKLNPEGAKSTEGNAAREGKDIKNTYIAKARYRDAIFIDQSTQSPVFMEADLLAEGVGQFEDRVYEFAFRWMIFANAYPELYQNVSPKVKAYIYKNNWFGLYNYCRESLNPSFFTEEVNFILNSNNL